MYMMKSPSVISPFRIAFPPTMIMITPMMPTMTVESAVVAETPVIDEVTLRNRRCTPSAKTICSRFSAVYALTTRMPPSACDSRPVTSALIFPRSRKMGRSFLKAYPITPPKAPSTTSVTSVSFQLR